LAVNKVFGPPGSGKTTYLLNVVEKELDEGVVPQKIGYFAFTRKAATEAKERAIAKFPELNSDLDFPWFRTLHSLAYHCLGVTTKDMMKPEDYKEFAQEARIDIGIQHGDGEFMVNADNPILNEINIARIRGEDLRVHYNKSAMDIEWYHFEYVERAYRHFKETRGLIDFTDLLERIAEQPNRLPELDVLIVDEAQDLSRLQWNIVQALVGKSKRSYVAGDDDQAVYNWAGADVNSFLDFQGDIMVLEKSWRVPSKVHELANMVVNRIRNRQPKRWESRDFEGEVQFYNQFEMVDITQGSWMILACTNYMLNNMHDWIKSQGLLYERHGHRSIPEAVLSAVVAWERLRKGDMINAHQVQAIYKLLDTKSVKRGHKTLKTLDPELLFNMDMLIEHHGLQTDGIWHEVLTKIPDDRRNYIIAMLRRGTKITGKPPITLSTIHGAKGGEADNVLLLMDLSTRFAKEYEKNSDDINRMFYVGITRARQTLHVVLPRDSRKGFRL
jgi:DNA helicase-2/ATP-dependent DNA helicase PcrA